jgi:hypothetical protein
MSNCPRCRKELRVGEPICAWCGFLLPSSVERSSPRAVPQKQYPIEDFHKEDRQYIPVDEVAEEPNKVSKISAAPVQPQESQWGINHENKVTFQSIEGWSQWVQGIFIALLVCSIFSIWSELSHIGVEAAGIVQILLLMLLIASAVLFLMWLYRANKNLPSLSEKKPQFSPGWSVGWFFVPFMSFFLPYQVVAEVWRTSYPKTDVIEETGFTPSTPSPIIVRCWWAFYLLRNFIGYIVLKASLQSYDISPSIFPTYVSVASEIIDVIGILITIFMVRQISQFQELKHRLINRIGANGYGTRY